MIKRHFYLVSICRIDLSKRYQIVITLNRKKTLIYTVFLDDILVAFKVKVIGREPSRRPGLAGPDCNPFDHK